MAPGELSGIRLYAYTGDGTQWLPNHMLLVTNLKLIAVRPQSYLTDVVKTGVVRERGLLEPDTLESLHTLYILQYKHMLRELLVTALR